MQELRPGVWHWTAPHPEWKPGEEWDEDAAWLGPDLERLEREGYVLEAGHRPPIGVEVFAGKNRHDLVFWIENHRVLVAGDTLIDRGDGLELPANWLPPDVTREQALEVLRPLLDLPVEIVLATHGGPHDRAALERALA